MKLFLSLTCVGLLVACGAGESQTPATANPPGELAGTTLATKPDGARSVLATKQLAAVEACAVSGRVAKIVPGHAVFTLMDTTLPYCGEKDKEDDCKTPWDYCCETAATRTANSLLVEFRDAAGKPLAGRLADLRLLDEVTVAGKLHKDEHGNHVLVASGWFRDTRPELAADLRWPK